VGYNHLRDTINDRTGSHNLLVGDENNFNSYGGLVAGSLNTISAPYSSVGGGYHNKAGRSYSSIPTGSHMNTEGN